MAYNYLTAASCLIFVFLAFSIKTRLSFRANFILNFEPEKCPFCIGQSFCNSTDDLRIEITLIDFIVGLFNHKYVFYGRSGNKSVIIKRLIRKEELSVLESEITSVSNDFSRLSNADFYDRSVQLLNHSFNDASYKLRLCPTVESALKFLAPLLRENNFINIWTTLHLNPEPLMLQVTSKLTNFLFSLFNIKYI